MIKSEQTASKKTRQRQGFSLVLATALISGFAIFINKFGVKGVDPYFYAFAKNFMAGGLLISILVISKNWRAVLKLKKPDILKLLLIGLIGGAIPFLFFFKGLAVTAAIKAGFIHKTLFVFTGIGAMLFLKEKIGRGMLLGLISLMLGSVLYLGVTPQALNIGDLYIFIAVLFWAFEIVISKHVLKKLSGTLVGSARLFIGSLFILLFLLVTGRAELLGGIGGNTFFWIIIGGALLTGYNWSFYNGLKYVKATEATAILTLGMPFTGILSALFLGNSLSTAAYLGIGFIILGAVLTCGLSREFLRLSYYKLSRVKIHERSKNRYSIFA